MRDRLQYSVVLTEGPDKGLRRWVWFDKGNIEKCMLGVISREYSLVFPSGRVCLREGGSDLELVSLDEQDANRFASMLGLSRPFLERDGGYVLNRYGE